MNQTYCPCPKCSRPRTKVVLTNRSTNEITIRRRWCPACGHRWYSIQHPEIAVRDSQIRWKGSNARFTSTDPLALADL